MLRATKTYVDAYVTEACRKRIVLHATLPARHDTVIRHIMSVKTFKSPTQRSEIYNKKTLVLCKYFLSNYQR